MASKNPHDGFFKKSFGQPEVVRSYLEEYLPADIGQLLDLEELVAQDRSFLDVEMRAHQSDLLYRVKLLNGIPAYVYLLFEHKSYIDMVVAFQLLRYMTRIWEEQVEAGEPLLPIIPLVIYHGEKEWRVPTNFSALFELPEVLKPYFPDFRYLLSDFSHLSDETIRGNIRLRVTLAVMRAIFSPYLSEELPDLISLMYELADQQTGQDYIRSILYYLIRATGRVTKEELRTALLQQGTQGETAMATIADEFIQEGIGIGVPKGLRRGIINALQVRFDDAPQEIRDRLNQITNEGVLDDLLKEAIVCASLDSFIKYLQATTLD